MADEATGEDAAYDIRPNLIPAADIMVGIVGLVFTIQG